MKRVVGIVASCAFTIAATALSGASVAEEVGTAPPTALDLRNTVTGEPLDLSSAMPEGRDTAAVKKFLQSGINAYNEDASCLPHGRDLFLTACSGCHGEIGEGKIGPGLADNYWTYPKNESDKGLFETIFGGANGQMGPHYLDLSLDDMMLVMAWVRHLYTGPVGDAPWLTEAQKKNYQPYNPHAALPVKGGGACKPMAQ